MKIKEKSMKKVHRENRTTLFDEVYQSLTEAKNSKIVVAFSGGRDSVALLHFLYSTRDELNLEIYACHVNHGIRGELADRDERFCRDFCDKLGIPIFVKKVDVPSFLSKNRCSVEDAARRLRYDALFKVLEQIKGDYLATAHHLDDIVETFFVKLFTGSAIYNLRGFSKEDRILRPFIDIDRGKIESYIESNNLTFVDDEMNFSSDYVRSWVRKDVIPIIKSYNKGYLNNIISIQEQSKELKIFLEQHLADPPIIFGEMFAEIEKGYILSKTKFERRYLLSKIFERFFRVEKRHIENALKLLSGESRRVNMPNNYIFEVSFSKVMIFHKNLIEPYNFIKNESDDIVILPKICKYIKFSGNLKDAKLNIRNRRSGDRVGGWKLKDLLIENRIDKFDRDRLVIVEKDGEIIWVEKVWERNNEVKLFKMEV